MSISKFNKEGYYDPTAYEAFSKIEKEERAAKSIYRPIVYICSAYSGDVDANVEKAQEYSRYAVDNGCIPITPHLLFSQFMDNDTPNERDEAMFFCKVLMSKCSEVWVFGENITEGMDEEIKYANKKRYRLRYFNKNLKEIQR